MNGCISLAHETMIRESLLTSRKQSVEPAYIFAFKAEPKGGYTVTCPALPGLVTYGETLKEAREMARDAMEGLIEVMRERGEYIPESNF